MNCRGAAVAENIRYNGSREFILSGRTGRGFCVKHCLLAFILLFCCAVPPATGVELDFSAADLDGDGYVTRDDLRILTEEKSTRAGAWRGDVDGSGRVDDADIRALAGILLRGSGRPPDDPAELDRAIRELSRPPGDAGGDPELVRDLERNREQLQVDRLRHNPPPGGNTFGRFRPPGGRGTTAGGGRGSRTGGPLPTAAPGSSQPVDLPGDALRRSIANLDKVVPVPAGNGGADASVQAINAIRNRIAGTVDGRSLESIFDTSVGKTPDALQPSEFPDPDLVTNRSGAPPLVIRSAVPGGDDGPGRFYPRSNYDMDVEKDRPEQPELTRRTGGGERQTLDDAYRPAAPPAQPPTGGEDLMDAEVPPLSDDPWLSQIMKDIRDPETFITATGGDPRRGPKSRGDTLLNLFTPENADAILHGGAGRVGLNPASTFVKNYLPLSEAILTNLAENGVISRGEADRLIRQIRDIANPPPPPPPPVASTPPPGTDSVGGTLVGDPTGGVTTADPISGAPTGDTGVMTTGGTGGTSFPTGTGSTSGTSSGISSGGSGTTVASSPPPTEVPWSIANPDAVADGSVVPVYYDDQGGSYAGNVTRGADGSVSWSDPRASESSGGTSSGQ